jgi:hypothetical protein
LLELEEDFKEYQQVNTNIAVRVVAIEHPWTESNGNPEGDRLIKTLIILNCWRTYKNDFAMSHKWE